MRKIIEIKDLDYVYPDGTRALQGITLNIFENESVGLIGPNGAGKSTLLLHLNGLLRTNSHIKILGREINNGNLSFVRSKVGLVFQDPDNQLFMPTVFDDVSFGPLNMGLQENQVISAVDRALEQVDMAYAKTRASHHLSFGEKKRISLATVLSMDLEILALDEPTSNLDPKHRRDLINLLKKMKLAKIIATHDLDMVLETCSRVALIDKGRLVAEGAAEEILRNKDLLEAHNLEVPLSLHKEK